MGWYLMSDNWQHQIRNKVHNKCHATELSPNHSIPLSPWENCLPLNLPLGPERLGTDARNLNFKIKFNFRITGLPCWGSDHWSDKESACQCRRHEFDPTNQRHEFNLGRSQMPWNNEVCVPQPLSQHSRAWDQQLPKPTCSKEALQQEKPLQQEAHVISN